MTRDDNEDKGHGRRTRTKAWPNYVQFYYYVILFVISFTGKVLKTLVDSEKWVPNGQVVVAINSHCVIHSLTSPWPSSLSSAHVLYPHCHLASFSFVLVVIIIVVDFWLLLVAWYYILRCPSLSRIFLVFVLHNIRPRHHLLHLSLVVHHRRFVISFYLMNVCPASNDWFLQISSHLIVLAYTYPLSHVFVIDCHVRITCLVFPHILVSRTCWVYRPPSSIDYCIIFNLPHLSSVRVRCWLNSKKPAARQSIGYRNELPTPCNHQQCIVSQCVKLPTRTN